jgi:hypothetical protein
VENTLNREFGVIFLRGRFWLLLLIDNAIYQESSHIIPALIIKALQRFESARIITNLPEKPQTVSDCSIRLSLRQKGPRCH